MPRGYGILGNRTPSYDAAHARVKMAFGSAKQYPCVECGGPAEQWAYDGTDPSELLELVPWSNGSGVARAYYSGYPEFYMPMCRRCHSRRDTITHRRHPHPRCEPGHVWKIKTWSTSGGKQVFLLTSN